MAWTGDADIAVNRSGESGQSYLVLDLRGKGSNTSFMFDLCLVLNLGVLYVPLIRFQNLFYISSLLVVLSCMGIKKLSNTFFCIY